MIITFKKGFPVKYLILAHPTAAFFKLVLVMIIAEMLFA